MQKLIKQKPKKLLTLLGESHPYMLFINRIRASLRDFSSEKKREVIELFDDAEINCPQVLANRDFWNRVNSTLVSGYKNQGAISLEEHQGILDRDFEKIRKIYESEFKEIKLGNYELLLLEFGNAQEVFAKNQKLKVINLDDAFEYYHPRSEEKGRELDYIRESHWIKTVQEYSDVSKLLIAGSKHVQNKFGLVTRLKEIGIDPEIKYTP